MQQRQDAKERSSVTRPATAGAAAGLIGGRGSSSWAALKQVQTKPHYDTVFVLHDLEVLD